MDRRTRPWWVTILLNVVFLDTLLLGLWALLQPRALFHFLGVAERNDTFPWELLKSQAAIATPRDAGLWPLLGVFTLAQAALVLAYLRTPLPGLLLTPLLGRLTNLGLWLWAYGAATTFPPERNPFPDPLPLLTLALHEALASCLLGAAILRHASFSRPTHPR